MALVLLSSTWPLWLGKFDMPVIPLFGGLRQAPWWIDLTCLVGLGLGLVGVAVRWKPIIQRWPWLIIVVCGSSLVALDQHRLQPWFYQLIIVALLFGLSQAAHARGWLTWIVISIYVYSALGKLDFEFLHTVGQQFWQGMWLLLGRAPTESTELAPVAWIAVLPLTELILAVGLAYAPTRRWAGALACLFHGLLMLLLGPWGLQHSWGVFFWNLQFAGQAWWLFVWPNPSIKKKTFDAKPGSSAAPQTVSRVAADWPGWGNALSSALALLVIGLPAVERLGYWDHWPSWALYAPHSSRVEVWLASSSVEQLPESLRQLMSQADDEPALWQRVPLERWSLAQTASPIYPQARFQLGVAVALARVVDSQYEIKAIVHGVASRWNGKRISKELEGTAAIERAAAENYWFNALPRDGQTSP
jgi:hypothetical protein